MACNKFLIERNYNNCFDKEMFDDNEFTQTNRFGHYFQPPRSKRLYDEDENEPNYLRQNKYQITDNSYNNQESNVNICNINETVNNHIVPYNNQNILTESLNNNSFDSINGLNADTTHALFDCQSMLNINMIPNLPINICMPRLNDSKTINQCLQIVPYISNIRKSEETDSETEIATIYTNDTFMDL